MLCVVAMAGMYVRAELSPLQESLKAALSLSDGQIAMLQGPALTIPLLIFAVPLGILVDRRARNHILLVATVIDVLVTVIGGMTNEFGVLLATRCAVGACAPVTTIAACSLISDWYRVDERGRAITVVVLGAIAGTAAAFAVGGKLLSISPGGMRDWHHVMLQTAGLMLPALLVSVFLREAPRRERAQKMPSIREMARELRHHSRVIVVLLVGLAMVNLADGATLVWTAPTLSRSFAMSPEKVGTIMGIAIFLSGIVGPLLGGPLTDLCQRSGGAHRAVELLTILAILSVPCSLFGAVTTVTLAICALVAFLTIGNMILVIVSTLTISVLPNELRGKTMTLQSGLAAVFGLGLAPIAVTLISGGLGGPASIGRALAIVCATSSLVGTLTFGCSRGMFRSASEGMRQLSSATHGDVTHKPGCRA